jgi:hypothetical protein
MFLLIPSNLVHGYLWSIAAEYPVALMQITLIDACRKPQEFRCLDAHMKWQTRTYPPIS